MAVVAGGGRSNLPRDSFPDGNLTSFRPAIQCHPAPETAAAVMISLGALGIAANLALMAVILLQRPLRR